MMVTRVATIAAGAAGLAHGASLDGAAAMFGNFRIEKLAAQRFEAFERAFLVCPQSAANTPHIRGDDCASRRSVRLALVFAGGDLHF
jgi:hypothetical protein